MKQWPGIRDDNTPVGSDDGFSVLVGPSYYMEGALGRRPGLTAITNTGGIALGSFRSAVSDTWLLVVTSSGTIESVSV